MKTTRRIFAIIVALAMVLSLCAMAIADGTTAHTITITTNGSEEHSYAAFQIFVGDYDSTTGKLSNIEWGSGIDGGAQLLADLQDSTDPSLGYVAAVGTQGEPGYVAAHNMFSNCTTARSVAEQLATLSDDSAAMKKIAEIIYEHLGTESDYGETVNGEVVLNVTGDGYYFILDTTAEDDMDLDYDTLSDFILEVVADIDVTPKDATVSVDKQVKDINDSLRIQDERTAAVSATDTADWDIGDDVPFVLIATLPSNYSNFKQFALTFNDTLSPGLTLDVDSIVITDEDENDITDYFTITSSTNAQTGVTTLTIACADLLEEDGTNGYLEDEEAITVEYTAELNSNADMTENGNTNAVNLTYSTDPNYNGVGTEPTNTTPSDTVTVFTYQLQVSKVNGSGDPLAGAGFTLSKFNGLDFTQIGQEVSAVATQVAGVDENDQPTTTTAYIASFAGLDDGVYKIEETTTPSGYNTAEPVYFEVVATHSEGANGASTTLTIYDGTVTPPDALHLNSTFTRGNAISQIVLSSDTLITTEVVNMSGSVLPSTGGIGTKIFMIGGSILVLGAGILIVAMSVSKRREEN